MRDASLLSLRFQSRSLRIGEPGTPFESELTGASHRSQAAPGLFQGFRASIVIRLIHAADCEECNPGEERAVCGKCRIAPKFLNHEERPKRQRDPEREIACVITLMLAGIQTDKTIGRTARDFRKLPRRAVNCKASARFTTCD